VSDDDVSDLRQEIARLRKVNTVLMRRVQRSMDTAGSDYGLFERTIHLQKLVDERTAELRARNTELEAARERAEAAVRSKSRFLATMSHELRTPLHVLLSAVQILHAELDGEQAQLLAMMDGAGDHLATLIDDILDFTRAESGALALSEGPTRIRDVVDSVVCAARHLPTSQGLTLQAQVDAQVPQVILADARRFKQVLFNLVGNACKFTDQGGVRVQVRADGDHLVVCVLDTGRGISAEALPRIQDHFVQARDDDARMHGGAGLGLAICRELVTLWEGDLTMHSTLGQGTEARFTVPLRTPVAAQVPTAPQAASPVGPVAVLLVDDQPVNRLVARKILELDGARVHEAASGEEALRFLQGAELPDLVLMDCQMPGMDGFEATRRLRAMPGPARRVRVVALTASVLDEDREQCMSAGMDGHLTKPLDREALRAELAQAVALARTPERRSA